MNRTEFFLPRSRDHGQETRISAKKSVSSRGNRWKHYLTSCALFGQNKRFSVANCADTCVRRRPSWYSIVPKGIRFELLGKTGARRRCIWSPVDQSSGRRRLSSTRVGRSLTYANKLFDFPHGFVIESCAGVDETTSAGERLRSRAYQLCGGKAVFGAMLAPALAEYATITSTSREVGAKVR